MNSELLCKALVLHNLKITKLYIHYIVIFINRFSIVDSILIKDMVLGILRKDIGALNERLFLLDNCSQCLIEVEGGFL